MNKIFKYILHYTKHNVLQQKVPSLNWDSKEIKVNIFIVLKFLKTKKIMLEIDNEKWNVQLENFTATDVAAKDGAVTILCWSKKPCVFWKFIHGHM